MFANDTGSKKGSVKKSLLSAKRKRTMATKCFEFLLERMENIRPIDLATAEQLVH